MSKCYIVEWVFRNDHSWHKEFNTREEAEHFINTCGFATHPDIVRFSIMEKTNAR